MTRIGIIVGSTRPGRRGRTVAEWVAGSAASHRADLEIVDLAEFALPLLDEEHPAISGVYGKEHTRRWSERIASLDGFVFVTPEYNHSVPGVLKNAIDYLFAEWNDKAAGVVSYGIHGGTRAAENLRLILAELQVATVRTQVVLSLHHDVNAAGELTPGEYQERSLTRMLDEVAAWSDALAPLRAGVNA
jgi:NAD(P)H-dependent FMN reductase